MRSTRNYFCIAIMAMLISSQIKAQTTLSAGDIAIIGYNYDASPQEMTIVVLRDISSGTVIRICDYGYDETTATFAATSVASTNEGALAWTTTSAIGKGTVFNFSITSGTTPSVSGLPGIVSITGWTSTNAVSSPAAAGGECWFIYQGTSPTAVSKFIFAFANPFATTFGTVDQPAGQFTVSGSGAPNLNNSYLPSSLTLGFTAIALNRSTAFGGYHGDNNVYTGIKTGTQAEVLTAICTHSNWLTDETTVYNIDVGGTNFSGTNPIFIITAGLPIRLLAFQGQAQDQQVTLSWTAADAVQFSHFEIERSNDGIQFTKIGQVALKAGAGNSSYSFTDDELTLPTAAHLFYRLKLVDLDSRFEYSTVLPIRLNNQSPLQVISTVPNPFTDRITLRLDLKDPGLLSLELFDLTGRKLVKQELPASRGTGNYTLHRLGNLPAGTYWLRTRIGDVQKNFQVIKQ